MELSWIIQLATTTLLGVIAYFLKRSMDRFENGMTQLGARIEQVETRHNEKLEFLKQELSDFKSELPLVYTLREDFLRVMNNVDSKLDKIIYRKGGDGNGV